MSLELNPIETCYRSLLKEGREIIRLFDGNPVRQGFQFPSAVLQRAYKDYFDHPGYDPDPKGALAAREVIAHYYEGRGEPLTPDNIILTSGTSESFFYLFSLLTQPGDNILAPNPAYPLFDHIASLAHISLKSYSLNEEDHWKIDFDSLIRQIDKRTKALVVISPNNPTGWVASQEEWAWLYQIADEYDLALIHDEVFSEFVYQPVTGGSGSVLCGLKFKLNGLSKMFALPQMKLGWITVAGDSKKVESAVDRLETIADTFLSTHSAIQMAVPMIFQEGRVFQMEYKKEVAVRRNLALNILRQSDKIGFVEPQGGFYAMVKIETGGSEEEFVIDLMRKKGVFVHPGYFFDYEKGTHCVISFLLNRKDLEAGLTRLVEFL